MSLEQIVILRMGLPRLEDLAESRDLEDDSFAASSMGGFDDKLCAEWAEVQQGKMRLLTIGRKDDGVRSVKTGGDELQVHGSLVDRMQGPLVGVDLENAMPD